MQSIMPLVASIRKQRVWRYWRRLLPALFLAAAAVSANASAVGGADPGPAGEYQVKAAFLYNFAKFVEWPAGAFETAQAPFLVCVLGADPFGTDLERTLKNEKIGGREINVRRIKRVQEREGCHILFVSKSERDSLPQILGALKNAAVLTVSEFDSFTQLGGMINLYVEDRRIRFEINVAPAENAGLKISSKLLKLAKVTR